MKLSERKRHFGGKSLFFIGWYAGKEFESPELVAEAKRILAAIDTLNKELTTEKSGHSLTHSKEVLDKILSEAGYLAPEILEYLQEHENHIYSDDLFREAELIAIANTLSGEAKEVLEQCAENPKYDGDVISKSGKSELYYHGLLTRVMFNGEPDFNGVNSDGYVVFKRIK